MKLRTRRIATAGAVAGLLVAIGGLSAQKRDPNYVPKQSDRPTPLEGDEEGFRPIFDGKTLNGWEGDGVHWRVENGAIVGEITPDTTIESNTFLIWQGGKPKDFEIKLEYRITEQGNSGLNYRSVVVPDPVTPENKWAMRGYQADFDGPKRFAGINYEEKGRRFLAARGQVTHVVGGRPPILLSTIADSDELGGYVKVNDWNSAHVIARGNTLMHMINGRLMSVVIDNDIPNRKSEGLLGVQVHRGPPMKVEYRNLRIKEW